MRKILVVEDDTMLNSGLCYNLELVNIKLYLRIMRQRLWKKQRTNLLT